MVRMKVHVQKLKVAVHIVTSYEFLVGQWPHSFTTCSAAHQLYNTQKYAWLYDDEQAENKLQLQVYILLVLFCHPYTVIILHIILLIHTYTKS